MFEANNIFFEQKENIYEIRQKSEGIEKIRFNFVRNIFHIS